MFLVDWITSLCSLAVCAGTYKFVDFTSGSCVAVVEFVEPYDLCQGIGLTGALPGKPLGTLTPSSMP